MSRRNREPTLALLLHNLNTLSLLWKIWSRLEYKRCIYPPKVTVLLTLDIERLHHIVINELKVFVANPVLHIPFPSSEEVVHHGHLVAIHHQLVSQVGTHKTSTTSDLVERKHVFILRTANK